MQKMLGKSLLLLLTGYVQYPFVQSAFCTPVRTLITEIKLSLIQLSKCSE